MRTGGLRSLSAALLLSGAAGAALGTLKATWQSVAIRAQILAHLVEYPADNPGYIGSVKIFSILNQACALLLKTTDSEAATCMVVSGFLGMLSFMAICALIFAICRDPVVSSIGPVFIYFGQFKGEGVVYPIALMGFFATYGIVGLSLSVLTIGLLGSRRYRSGMFLLGLAPSVHPALGTWTFGLVCLTALFSPRRSLKVLRKAYPFFIAGVAVSAVSLALHIPWIRNLPEADDPQLAAECYRGYKQHWDSHSEKAFWDYRTDRIDLFKPGILICCYSIILGVLGRMAFRRRPSVLFLFRLLTVSGVLSLILAALTHAPPGSLPTVFFVLVPARFMNINNVTFAACLLGMLCSVPLRRTPACIHTFFCLCLLLIAPMHLLPRVNIFYPAMLAILALTVVARRNPAAAPSFLRPGTGRPLPGQRAMLACAVLAFALYRIGLPRLRMADIAGIGGSGIEDRTDNEVYSALYGRPGMLLTTKGFYMVSLPTRRPVLLEATGIDIITYTPGSAARMNDILMRVYGIDVRQPPPPGCRPYGAIPPELHKGLWEQRSLAEWQQIRDEYNVTDILTPADWQLKLQVLAGSNREIAYTIPSRGNNDDAPGAVTREGEPGTL